VRIVAIANQKGGTAKTTTAVNLAARLAMLGREVVLIDLDSQGSASACLGLVPSPGVHQWLIGGADFDAVTVEIRPHLRLLASDASTAKAELSLAGEDYRHEVLADRLAHVNGAEYIILDCAPSRGLLHVAAHHAADLAIIPVQVDHLAVVGCMQEMSAIDAVRKRGHVIEVLAILPTFFESVTLESTQNLAELRRLFGDLVADPIPRATKVREASAYGHTVFEHLATGHPVCVAYRKLGERVLKNA